MNRRLLTWAPGTRRSDSENVTQCPGSAQEVPRGRPGMSKLGEGTPPYLKRVNFVPPKGFVALGD